MLKELYIAKKTDIEKIKKEYGIMSGFNDNAAEKNRFKSEGIQSITLYANPNEYNPEHKSSVISARIDVSKIIKDGTYDISSMVKLLNGLTETDENDEWSVNYIRFTNAIDVHDSDCYYKMLDKAYKKVPENNLKKIKPRKDKKIISYQNNVTELDLLFEKNKINMEIALNGKWFKDMPKDFSFAGNDVVKAAFDMVYLKRNCFNTI